MREGDSFHCPPHTVHRMVAVTDVDVIEVSTPELDDVVRLEDSYGRQGTSEP
jgi:mannose-6-phosphate isomerase